jgi:RimJ/RimL family protein N-acetyltransferase
MDLTFSRFEAAQGVELADFLASEIWPFHSGGGSDREQVLHRVAEGRFDDVSTRCYWVGLEGERAGFLRIFDLEDETPLFDLRIRERLRGRGVGTRTVAWMVDHVFAEWPHVTRIEAHTRQDNVAMRRTLLRTGFLKEAHHRQAWPGPDRVHDSVGYGILRSDRELGTLTPVEWDDEPTG